jgi:nitrite reductase (NADH) small subunit
MVGDINGEPVVASPLYKQHFSLRSGQCLEQDDQVPCYSIRVHDDRIELAEKN